VNHPLSQSEIIHPCLRRILSGSTTGFLILTRLAQRSLMLQPGNSLISPKLTLSVGFSTSITLRAATQARRLLALTAAGLPSPTESHPMDHDSNSSGHTKTQAGPNHRPTILCDRLHVLFRKMLLAQATNYYHRQLDGCQTATPGTTAKSASFEARSKIFKDRIVDAVRESLVRRPMVAEKS
jgi:hypothetical protein